MGNLFADPPSIHSFLAYAFGAEESCGSLRKGHSRSRHCTAHPNSIYRKFKIPHGGGIIIVYPARVACKLTGISPRNLDYWITTGLFSPHSVYRGPKQQRHFFLFAFAQLVQLRIIVALRRTGVSLQKVRAAVDALREQGGSEWHSLWLVSDGVNIHVVRQPDVLEALTGSQRGQLAFSVVAMGSAVDDVRAGLLRLRSPVFEATKYRGKIDRFDRAV